MEKAELSRSKNSPRSDVERATAGRKAFFPEGPGGTINSESERRRGGPQGDPRGN